MCGVACQTDSTNPELLGASLMQLVGAYVGDGVLIRSWMTGEELFILGRLVIDNLLESHVLVFLVGNAPQSVFCKASNEVAFL